MSSVHSIWKTGILSVSVNFALMLIKIGAGLIGQSYALIADGIESASDLLSGFITWVGFHLSLKPADDNHPYGHGKLETLSGLLSGISLLTGAFFIAWNAVGDIHSPRHTPAWYTLPILLLIVIIKEGLSRKMLKLNSNLHSTAIRGDAWHHRSDAITSATSALGISVALIGGPSWAVADSWAALVTCFIITFNATRIIWQALGEMTDVHVGNEIQVAFIHLAREVKSVREIDKCRIRKSGIDLFVEIQIRVDGQLTVREGHDIGHKVKAHMMQKHPRIIDVLVHVEPYPREL